MVPFMFDYMLLKENGGWGDSKIDMWVSIFEAHF